MAEPLWSLILLHRIKEVIPPKEGLEKWHKKADGKCSCDYSFHMSIVEWNEETKKEIRDMINEGITSFKLYMTYPAMIVDDEDLYKIIKALNEKGCFAGVHCENAGVIDALIQEAKAQGKLGPENHPLVRPDTMEAEAVHRLLVIAKEAGAPVMVVHLTNLQGIRRNRPCPGKWSDRICRDLSSVSSSGRQRLFQTSISKVPNMCALRQSARKRIRTACGKLWRMEISRQ
ncbi:MAG: hypothetical protein ACLS61_21810 [Ruminococcus sp.]